MSFAYTHWQNYGGEQVASEGPEWTQKEHFDVEAKLTDAEMAGWRKMTYYPANRAREADAAAAVGRSVSTCGRRQNIA